MCKFCFKRLFHNMMHIIVRYTKAPNTVGNIIYVTVHVDMKYKLEKIISEKLLTIQAKLSCPANWTTEYSGYLMAAHDIHNGRTEFECIDNQPESVPGLNGFDDQCSLLSCGGNMQQFQLSSI